MGEEGASTTAPDFQTMLKRVQETNYQTSIDEQKEKKKREAVICLSSKSVLL